jgi:hypothetical protein
VATAVPMTTFSRIVQCQRNNQPQPDLYTTFLDEKSDELTLFYRFYGLALSDSWRRLLLRAPFLQWNDIDVTHRLRLYYLRINWMKLDEVESSRHLLSLVVGSFFMFGRKRRRLEDWYAPYFFFLAGIADRVL